MYILDIVEHNQLKSLKAPLNDFCISTNSDGLYCPTFQIKTQSFVQEKAIELIFYLHYQDQLAMIPSVLNSKQKQCPSSIWTWHET